MLQEFTCRAKTQGIISRVITNLMLQYVDGNAFFIEGNEDNARILKSIVCIFEHLSGLKVK